MSTDSRTWRHHYVAQFILRQWTTDDGALHEYARRPGTGAVVRKTRYPREAGFEKHLYSYEPDGFVHPDPDGLEYALRDAETKAAPVLDKMLAAGISGLTEAEKATWASLMHIQLDRGPRSPPASPRTRRGDARGGGHPIT